MGLSERDLRVYATIWQEEVPPPPRYFAPLLAAMRGPTECRTIADLGCGAGRFAIPAARTGARVLAIDHHPVAIRRLRAAAPGAICVQAEFPEWLRCAPASFSDLVICCDALHH